TASGNFTGFLLNNDLSFSTQIIVLSFCRLKFVHLAIALKGDHFFCTACKAKDQKCQRTCKKSIHDTSRLLVFELIYLRLRSFPRLFSTRTLPQKLCQDEIRCLHSVPTSRRWALQHIELPHSCSGTPPDSCPSGIIPMRECPGKWSFWGVFLRLFQTCSGPFPGPFFPTKENRRNCSVPA